MDNHHLTPDNHMHNIVLIGFMGCGKSTIGRELHNTLGYQHIDTDQFIEERLGKSIPDIFAQDGEDSFRIAETNIIQEFTQQKLNHHIISTGGGMPIRPKNQTLLKQLGFVVWLSCSPEDILERTSRNSNRPLLNCDAPLQKITQLLKERTPIYKKASHLKINTSALDFDEISCGILESARYHFSTTQQST